MGVRAIRCRSMLGGMGENARVTPPRSLDGCMHSLMHQSLSGNPTDRRKRVAESDRQIIASASPAFGAEL